MAKKNVNAQGMTCEQMKAQLKVIVDAHNESKDIVERNNLKNKAISLKDDYKKVSLLDVYAEAMESESPMLSFIKAYTYPTLSVTTKKDTGNLSIKDDGKEVMNLWNFVEWAEGCNKQVAKELDWKSKAAEAQKVLISIAENYINTKVMPEPTELKAALQAAFDSVVFLKGKGDNNAIIAKSKACREIIMTCGNIDFKSLQANFGQSKTWQKQFFAYLHCAAEGKSFTLTFGDPEEQSTNNAAETPAEESTTEEVPATETSATEEVKAE